jgi:hypothetical protein
MRSLQNRDTFTALDASGGWRKPEQWRKAVDRNTQERAVLLQKRLAPMKK